MRAAILRDRQIVVDHVATPEPGPGEVLVRSLACGICGSDLHAFQRDTAEDLVMGHEFCVELVDYGPGTARRFKPGDRLCSIPVINRPDGAVFLGYAPNHPGGYGEYLRLTEAHLLAVPNGLPTAEAALTEPMAVGYRAVRKARLGPDDVPLVLGCGPVGLAVIASLVLAGARPIIAADFSPARRALALTLGADIAVDPAESAPFDTWRALAQTGQPDPGPCLPGWLVGSGLKPAVIFDCVGSPGMLDRIVAEAPQDARIVVLGLCRHAVSFQPFVAVSKELNIQFSNTYTRDEYAETLHHIAEGRLKAAPLVTGTVGLSGVAQACRDLAHPDRHAKILIEPWRD